MSRGIMFLALGAALLAGAGMAGGWAGRLVCLYAALPCLALAAAYGLRRPGVFLKKADGRLSPPSRLLFGAYHAANFLFLACHRRLARKDPWHDVIPGLYVGEQPGRGDEALWQARRAGRVLSVLDLTAELPEPVWIRDNTRYLCLPLLDRTGPAQSDLKRGLMFIHQGMAEGIVLVHCAFGHGRSALYVAAYLVASGRCPGVEEAWSLVETKRPGAYLNRAQRSCLEQAAGSLPILSGLPDPARSGC